MVAVQVTSVWFVTSSNDPPASLSTPEISRLAQPWVSHSMHGRTIGDPDVERPNHLWPPLAKRPGWISVAILASSTGTGPVEAFEVVRGGRGGPELTVDVISGGGGQIGEGWTSSFPSGKRS